MFQFHCKLPNHGPFGNISYRKRYSLVFVVLLGRTGEFWIIWKRTGEFSIIWRWFWKEGGWGFHKDHILKMALIYIIIVLYRCNLPCMMMMLMIMLQMWGWRNALDKENINTVWQVLIINFESNKEIYLLYINGYLLEKKHFLLLAQ